MRRPPWLAWLLLLVACSGPGPGTSAGDPSLPRILDRIKLAFDDPAPSYLTIDQAGVLYAASSCQTDACALGSDTLWTLPGDLERVLTTKRGIGPSIVGLSVRGDVAYAALGFFTEPSLVAVSPADGGVRRLLGLPQTPRGGMIDTPHGLVIGGEDRIYVVDPRSGRIVSDFRAGPEVFCCGYDPTRRHLYVTHSATEDGKSTISIYEMPSAEPVRDVVVETVATRMVFDENAGRMLIPADGALVTVEGGSFRVRVARTGLNGVDAAADRERVYVIGDSGMIVLARRTLSLRARIPFGVDSGPESIAVDAKTGRIYVGLAGSNEVVALG